jgi:hypothetical protein
MSNKVNPPPQLRIPGSLAKDRESRSYLEQVNIILNQLFTRTGASTDLVAEANADTTSLSNAIDAINDEIDEFKLDNRIVVKEAADLAGDIDSTKEYFIDGVIDMGETSIEVPVGGISISGYNFDASQLVSSYANYTLFTSVLGGCGNVVLKNVGLTTDGPNSKVFDLTSANSLKALEIISVNFNDCESLGELTGFRQYLETGTGRFGGMPELTFTGNWNGARIDTSIVRSTINHTGLFKAGTGLVFSGRFVTDINCDLPSTGSLFDFDFSNFTNDESLVVQGAFITRDGVIDPTDSSIYPNIDNNSIKSNWEGNTGLPNTYKYFKASCTTEVTTTISAANTFYTLLGTFTEDDEVHFDMPSNGEFRLLTGDGAFNVTSELIIEGTANNVIAVRVTKSTDGGATWPTVVSSLRRQINNIVGGRDVAFFPINFITTLAKDDRLRLEVENQTGTGNVTMELDSYFILSEV